MLFIFQKVIDNGMGSKNNLVTVKMSDFEVFQALAKDSEGVSSSAQTEYSQVNLPLEYKFDIGQNGPDFARYWKYLR